MGISNICVHCIKDTRFHRDYMKTAKRDIICSNCLGRIKHNEVYYGLSKTTNNIKIERKARNARNANTNKK